MNKLSLKWGTLKSWNFDSEKGKSLINEYLKLGYSFGGITQDDTPSQKNIICDLIDECDDDTIYLEWDGVNVSKQEAKDYVMNYGKK